MAVRCRINPLFLAFLVVAPPLFAGEIKQPDVAGQFYPASKEELTKTVRAFLQGAELSQAAAAGKVLALISPHAGYQFSGSTAGYGYKLIQGRKYSTVVVLGTGHRYAFSGMAVYPAGVFRTPLGDIPIDEDFCRRIIDGSLVRREPRAFDQEHSVEVQLPFLQAAVAGFRLVPVVVGSCSFEDCAKFAERLRQAIGTRDDVLIVASSDMYHGYDYEEADKTDAVTLKKIAEMDARGLYAGLADGSMQLCGGYGVVSTLLLAKSLGHDTSILLRHANSAQVAGNMTKGIWTVGYASVAIDSEGEKGEAQMLTIEQKKRLLEIARRTIENYLKTGKKQEITENDPLLRKEMGAFVTLHQRGQLRGCIGMMVGSQPLYLTIRDMAVEAATGDPRFMPVRLADLKDIEIEISVLSLMEKTDSAENIELGKHGVMVRKGISCGVFLPQVATETGWSKEEFLSCLCEQKAGLSPDAWKDKSTDLYTFTATVFSEKEMK
jgi:MEMO1 family protein